MSIDGINTETNGSLQWYDVGFSFDNINNFFMAYVKRSADTASEWSYTDTFLYNTTSLTATNHNCLIQDTTPINYPENVTWTQIYLLKSSIADIYVDNAKKTKLKYVMVADDFVPPTEFNWIRRFFHYWQHKTGTWPK